MKQFWMALILATIPMISVAKVETPDETSSVYPEPEITIIDSENKKIEVHKINGRVYKIKVVPKNGKPYFLVDKIGDGDFIRDSGADKMQVPEWVLISW